MKNFWSRRDFLFQSSGGLAGLALAHLLDQDRMLASEGSCSTATAGPTPYSAKKPHFPARAKSVISLFMSGVPSHMDRFDPKPALLKYAGQPLTGKGEVVVRQGHPGPLMPAVFSFKKDG